MEEFDRKLIDIEETYRKCMGNVLEASITLLGMVGAGSLGYRLGNGDEMSTSAGLVLGGLLSTAVYRAIKSYIKSTDSGL